MVFTPTTTSTTQLIVTPATVMKAKSQKWIQKHRFGSHSAEPIAQWKWTGYDSLKACIASKNASDPGAKSRRYYLDPSILHAEGWCSNKY